MHVIPKVIDDSITIIDNELNKNDSIFNSSTTMLYGGIDDPLTTNDRDYNKPDHSCYVFSTMGANISVMFQSNMVSTVRSKPTINGFTNYHNKLMKMLGKNGISKGVYVVEYYNIYDYDKIHRKINDVIEYYIDNEAISYNINMTEELKNRYKHNSDRFTIRVITYIPAEVIDENIIVYDEITNLMFIKGNVDKTMAHPKSIAYDQTNDTINNTDIKNNIIIDIVDNRSIQPYYIKVGKTVHRLIPRKDPSGKEKSKIITKTNNIVINEITCGIDEVTDVLGLHRTIRDAEVDGDMSTLHSLEKIRHERDKLQHDMEKLKLDKELELKKKENELFILKNKLEISKLDVEKKEKELKLAEEKARIEQETAKLKFENEMAISKQKADTDTIKSLVDTFLKMYVKIVL